jgi:hypothetical protein
MSSRGRWRVVETPGYDMAVAGAYILFDEVGGEFAFDLPHGLLINGNIPFIARRSKLLQQPAGSSITSVCECPPFAQGGH